MHPRAQPLGGRGVLTPQLRERPPPTFETGFFFGGGSVLGESVTRGVGTILYESLQCTNHHVEPAFRCKINQSINVYINVLNILVKE